MAEPKAKPVVHIDTDLFENLGGKELLESIRKNALPATKAALRAVLGRIQEKNKQDDRTQNGQLWRLYRMKVYNNLLPLALGAEGRELKEWMTADHSIISDKAISQLKPGSIYSYLLDKIHEDEEIMFKYYHAQSRAKKPILRRRLNFRPGKPIHREKPRMRDFAPWLVESIRMYREHLVHPVVEALKKWEEVNEDIVRGKLLAEAKEAFKDIVSSQGRSLYERSSWNRARLYWLLAQANHAVISDGQAPGNFKSFTYSGPIGTLVREMIKEDHAMFLDKPKDEDSSLLQFTKVKYDKLEKDSKPLGTFRICSLLDWASAVNDQELVKGILQHKEEYLKKFEWDLDWEESWAESWANALWIAAFKGHAQVVKELLNCKFPSEFPYHEFYSEHYSKESLQPLQPPLHVAVRRGHISVVEVFCTESVTKNFSFHEEDHAFHQTPLEVASSVKEVATKRKIQSILLNRDEVKQAVDELSKQREMTVNSANAILVGAVLIAGAAYGGWLAPPLGYHTYYQFTEPLPAPPDTFSSYLSIQGHTTIEVFAFCNTLSFFFAVAAVVAGMETTCFIEALEETYMAKTVENLRYKLKWTTGFFIASVICVLIAFASAAVAILPPIKYYQRRMYVAIGVGGFFCLVFICRMLLFCVSKRLYKWTTSHFWRLCKWIAGKFNPN